MTPAYDIQYCDEYIDELLDKLGSDLFPIDIKMKRFIGLTYSFIRAHVKLAQATQEISDDVKSIFKEVVSAAVPVAGQAGLYSVSQPDDYFRLVSLMPLVGSVRRAKKVYLVKEGQREAYERDPHRTPSPSYPHVYQPAGVFEFNVGTSVDVYNNARIRYFKEPVFGEIDTPTDRIVDLPDIAIEQICLKTAESLRFTTADATAASVFQFDSIFGKKNAR